MIRAIAIDDEPLPLEIISGYCDELKFVKLERTFTRTSEALKFLKKFPVDLLFLDVNMPAVSGIDFYKRLDWEPMVIFTTAHPQYAVDGFELNAVDYLLKPYSFDRFKIALKKALEFHDFFHHKAAREKHIFIRSEYSLVKVLLNEISCIEGLADYLKIHLINGKTLLTRMTMKGIVAKLPSKEFIRVHRSFIVPFNRIKSVRNKTIHLDDRKIPIGISYEEAFSRVFHQS